MNVMPHNLGGVQWVELSLGQPGPCIWTRCTHHEQLREVYSVLLYHPRHNECPHQLIVPGVSSAQTIMGRRNSIFPGGRWHWAAGIMSGYYGGGSGPGQAWDISGPVRSRTPAHQHHVSQGMGREEEGTVRVVCQDWAGASQAGVACHPGAGQDHQHQPQTATGWGYSGGDQLHLMCSENYQEH